MLEAFGIGAANLLRPEVIGLLIAGSTMGYVFGILPGLGGTAAMALCLPFLFGADVHAAMYLLAGIIGANACGGAVTAILLNTPGTAVNAATTLDGYPMAQKGKAQEALSLAALSSLFGAIFGIVVLVLLIPILTALIMRFGPAEYFMLCLLAFVVIATAIRGNVIKGLASVCVGLLLSFTSAHPKT